MELRAGLTVVPSHDGQCFDDMWQCGVGPSGCIGITHLVLSGQEHPAHATTNTVRSLNERR